MRTTASSNAGSSEVSAPYSCLPDMAQLQQAQIEESIATRRQAVVELQVGREAAALQVKEAVESAQAELKSRYVCCCSHAHSWLLMEVQDH